MADLGEAKQKLADGAKQLQVCLTQAQLEQFSNYITLLQKWNKVYNLTAIADEEQIVIRHFLDCLAVVPYLPDGPILDVGSGAGFPGLVWAIIRPKQKVVLVDSLQKRTSFLQAVKTSLKLNHVEIVHTRVDHYHSQEVFSVITSRAFADLTKFINLTKHLSHNSTTYLALKGRLNQEELDCLDGLTHCLEVYPLHIPYLFEQRHLITFQLS